MKKFKEEFIGKIMEELETTVEIVELALKWRDKKNFTDKEYYRLNEEGDVDAQTDGDCEGFCALVMEFYKKLEKGDFL